MNFRPSKSFAFAGLVACLLTACFSGCTSSDKARQIANEPVLPGQQLEFFGRGNHSNHYTPKAVNRESYAPQVSDAAYYDDVYSK